MNDLRMDPEAVRGFGDDVWTELETTVRPWIAEIVAELGTENVKADTGFGSVNVAYGGSRLDTEQSQGAADLKRWLAALSNGMEALALGSAVMAEQIADTDVDAALWIDKRTSPNKRGMAV